MKDAKKVCVEYKLDKLIVPEASLITIPKANGKQYVIAEKEYQFEHGLSKQSRLYDKYEKELGDIVEQLTILICKTKVPFADVKWDNIPLMIIDGCLRVLY